MLTSHQSFIKILSISLLPHLLQLYVGTNKSCNVSIKMARKGNVPIDNGLCPTLRASPRVCWLVWVGFLRRKKTLAQLSSTSSEFIKIHLTLFQTIPNIMSNSTFLFTSESVNEGHPGTCFRRRLFRFVHL